MVTANTARSESEKLTVFQGVLLKMMTSEKLERRPSLHKVLEGEGWDSEDELLDVLFWMYPSAETTQAEKSKVEDKLYAKQALSIDGMNRLADWSREAGPINPSKPQVGSRVWATLHHQCGWGWKSNYGPVGIEFYAAKEMPNALFYYTGKTNIVDDKPHTFLLGQPLQMGPVVAYDMGRPKEFSQLTLDEFRKSLEERKKLGANK